MTSIYWSSTLSNAAILLVPCLMNFFATGFLGMVGKPNIEPIRVALEFQGTRRRLAVVTGSNTGVGYATAKELVVEYGVDVIVACRSKEKGLHAVETINREAKEKAGGSGRATANKDARAYFIQPLDLSNFQSVREFSRVLHEEYVSIDILVNNAGRNTGGFLSAEDSIEVMFQTNYWSHFLLTNLVLDMFPQEGTGRIINLSSVMHHFLNDPLLDSKDYWNNFTQVGAPDVYAASKLAAILFTKELNRRYYNNDNNDMPRIRSFATDPGAVNSDIYRDYPKWVLPFIDAFFLNIRRGASTTIAASVGDFGSPDVFYLQPYWFPSAMYNTKEPLFPSFEMFGPYVGHRITQPRLPTNSMERENAQEALFTVSEQVTGCKFPEVVSGEDDIQGTQENESEDSQNKKEIKNEEL